MPTLVRLQKEYLHINYHIIKLLINC